MKIWLMTCGEYSDYHVVAAFSSEEKAKEAIEARQTSDGRDYAIEEYELDEIQARDAYDYRVYFFSWGSHVELIDDPADWRDLQPMGSHKIGTNWDGKRVLSFRLEARNADHALKMAVDMRRQLIERGEVNPSEVGA